MSSLSVIQPSGCLHKRVDGNGKIYGSFNIGFDKRFCSATIVRITRRKQMVPGCKPFP
ncbi:hypothetical protein JCM6294_1909 [Bacteroides pyogenes DSM 20611 = JCM 6294]|uniref:Uncharacterized protein n=1 Tax=Bacteroides pyogenes DSM 20611 = JCM 6294 TaxID=1121100 RepID=W4PII6_9BACE|nr:hypothetical protein JCM6294_1909 [Bacteroides pyogenes DSM 20611 = JCM 6294]